MVRFFFLWPVVVTHRFGFWFGLILIDDFELRQFRKATNELKLGNDLLGPVHTLQSIRQRVHTRPTTYFCESKRKKADKKGIFNGDIVGDGDGHRDKKIPPKKQVGAIKYHMVISKNAVQKRRK